MTSRLSYAGGLSDNFDRLCQMLRAQTLSTEAFLNFERMIKRQIAAAERNTDFLDDLSYGDPRDINAVLGGEAARPAVVADQSGRYPSGPSAEIIRFPVIPRESAYPNPQNPPTNPPPNAA